MSRFLVCFLLLLFPVVLTAQNLVPNPGFEDHKKVPISYCHSAKEFYSLLNDWSLPNEGTSDYFHAECRGKAAAMKHNFAGIQKPQEGDAYAGFFLYYPDAPSYREYLQARLKEPLKAGQTYVVQFYVSLSESSEFALDRFGALFTPKPVRQQSQFRLKNPVSVTSPDSLFFDDKTGWTLVGMRYTAAGGERFLVIGNFERSDEMHLKKVDVNKKKYYKENGAYYYVDNVCVALEDEDGNCFCPDTHPADSTVVVADTLTMDTVVQTIPTPQPGATYVLRSVLFDTDKAELKPDAFPALDSLVELLLANPEFKISISGHTDNSGDEKKNRPLSERRAKAVADYLISNGIAAGRVRYAGYGSARPVTGNETPEGRALNRRVEYVLEQ